MDNLFDYLIILFFIFSAVGSLFKKKPEQKKKYPKTEMPSKSEPISSQQESGYENPFDLGKSTNDDTVKEVGTYYDKSDSIEDKFEKSIEAQIPIRISESKKDKKSDTGNTTVTQSFYKSNIYLGIRQKLSNTESIKESIIIAEILNKPKALRYSGKNLHY